MALANLEYPSFLIIPTLPLNIPTVMIVIALPAAKRRKRPTPLRILNWEVAIIKIRAVNIGVAQGEAKIPEIIPKTRAPNLFLLTFWPNFVNFLVISTRPN